MDASISLPQCQKRPTATPICQEYGLAAFRRVYGRRR